MKPLLNAFRYGLLLLTLVGCKRLPPAGAGAPAIPAKSPATTQAADGESKISVEPSIGTADSSKWGYLGFRIERLHHNQQPTTSEVGYGDGGNWTFLDCVATGPEGDVRFTVGVRGNPPDAQTTMSWGKATLQAANGAAFVKRFANAFHTQVPLQRKTKPLIPIEWGTALLGDNLTRQGPGGGFSGAGGTWTCTKWFPSADGLEAEVFFNYSLATMEGEFSEKDPDYRADLLDIFAATVRDGPRGQRTPEEDANIIASGPCLGALRRIAGPEARDSTFAPDGQHLLFVTDHKCIAGQLWATELDSTSQPVLVAAVEKYVWSFQPADRAANQLVILEKLLTQPGSISSDDPTRIWWIDRAKGIRHEINGAWNRQQISLPSSAVVSPDGRFVILTEWKKADRINYQVLHFVDTQTWKEQSAELIGKDLEPIDWQNDAGKLSVHCLTGFSFNQPKDRESYVIDPTTGRMEKRPNQLPMAGTQTVRSPDGRLKARVVDKARLEITPVEGGSARSLTFHPDDARFVSDTCVAWANDRYLIFHNPGLVLIDAQTMKMNYPVAASLQNATIIFSPDFRHVAVETQDALQLGPIVGGN